ncbi:hypothetical protein D3C78_1419250 [compost metagenome]
MGGEEPGKLLVQVRSRAIRAGGLERDQDDRAGCGRSHVVLAIPQGDAQAADLAVRLDQVEIVGVGFGAAGALLQIDAGLLQRHVGERAIGLHRAHHADGVRTGRVDEDVPRADRRILRGIDLDTHRVEQMRTATGHR